MAAEAVEFLRRVPVFVGLEVEEPRTLAGTVGQVRVQAAPGS